MTGGGVDRELLAVLVALEPLDDRKWDYLNLRERTFHAYQMQEVPWSSGERILVDVAASLAVARNISQATVRPTAGPQRPDQEFHIGSLGDDSPVHRQSRGLGR